jgi:hypothetical protein
MTTRPALEKTEGDRPTMKIKMPPRLHAAARRRWEVLHEYGDRGASAFEWVLITAFCALMITAVYAAVNSKVLEKIGIIKGS